jgi:predicted SprT family Zn-dependent metalloprotease
MATVRQFAALCGATYEIERCLTFYPEKAQSIWDANVGYSNALKTAGGQAKRRAGIISIELNPKLPQISGEPKSTFLHEVAHCLQYIIYGKGDHGFTFWEIMFRLGQKPTRCHSYDFRSIDEPDLNIDDLGL